MRNPSQQTTVVPLRSWGADVLSALPRAANGEEDGIHDLRVAARRLRLAVPILARDPEARAVRRLLSRLRSVGRAAAATRDLDVMAGLLGENDLARTPEGRGLAERVRVDRASEAARIANDLANAEEDVARGLSAVTARGAEALFVVMLRVRHVGDELADTLAHQLETAAAFDPEALHELRISIRRLRFVLDLVAEIRGTRSEVTGLKRLQNALGRVQDARVLAGWLRHEARLAGERQDVPVRTAALRAARESMRVAREHHAAFLALEPHGVIAAHLAALQGGPALSGGPAHPPAPLATP